MLNINMETKFAFNQNSILSINTSQGIKNQNTILNPYKKESNQNNKNIITLQNSVKKGQKIELPISSNDIIEARFGWNTTNTECDVDVSAFLIGENEKVLGDSWFVFYGQTNSPDNSTIWISETQCQKIKIDFKNINTNVKKIVFVLTIDEALSKRLNFGMIKDAYVKILDSHGKEMVSFMMTEYYNNVISMMIGELYFYRGKWKFHAIGDGIAKDLAGLCEWYGVQVI